ncbi:MAG: hypothetical protein J0I84_22095 [Terrimonas sp.]|nr:hypothetical protein [Terrimonas sp.]OJY99602.1 MAG: hypothetical protein BGP13_22640 [Sphingobacteriales bacterium 40-81]
MGTSNSYGGPGGGTPLVPSWLGDGDGGNPPPPTSNGGTPNDGNNDGDGNNGGEGDGGSTNPNENNNNNNNNSNDGKPPTAPANRPAVQAGSSDRFTHARTNFTQFVKSGGRDRSKLGKSISNYVSKSNGGSRNAARRLGSSRRATTNLLNFFSSVQNRGSAAALQALNLDDLVGKSVEEIFLGLSDYVCPDGGNVDEGIARSAFIETIAELAESGIADIDALTPDQMQSVLEIFATHAIEERLCNDIGTKICIAAENIQSFERVQAQLHDFIKRSVSDAFTKANINIKSMTPDKTQILIDNVYESAFGILQTMADEEADIE